MVQSLELLLDEGSESALRGSWDALAAAGLPSLASHTSETNRPHVTVAAAEEGLDGALDAVRAVVAGWGLGTGGLAAVVGSPVLFGGAKQRWVLARQIVPSRPLLTLHAAVHRALSEHAPEAEVDPQTTPDGWTAHVTLSRRMPADRLAEALAVVDPEPIPFRFTGLRFWDSPSKTVTDL